MKQCKHINKNAKTHKTQRLVNETFKNIEKTDLSTKRWKTIEQNKYLLTKRCKTIEETKICYQNVSKTLKTRGFVNKT